jgi:hypothetical protein
MQTGNFIRIYKITIKIGLKNVGYSPNILELARGTANMLAHRQHFLMAFNGKKCIHIRLETNILGIAQSH